MGSGLGSSLAMLWPPMLMKSKAFETTNVQSDRAKRLVVSFIVVFVVVSVVMSRGVVTLSRS